MTRSHTKEINLRILAHLVHFVKFCAKNIRFLKTIFAKMFALLDKAKYHILLKSGSKSPIFSTF